MWTDELATHLRAQNIPGIGQNVFSGSIPQEVKVALMVAAMPVSIDPELPGYHKGRVQLISRAKTSLLAEELATAGMNELTISSQDVGNIYINYLRPVHLPVSFPRSNGDYYEASVNFDICFLSDMA